MKKHLLVFLHLLVLLLMACGDNAETALPSPVVRTQSTDMSTPTITLPAATPIHTRPVPTSLPTPKLSEATGHIYLWKYSPSNSRYAQLALKMDAAEIQLLVVNSPGLLGPKDAIDLVFSNYSRQVAYLTLTEKLQLWIADTNLEQVQMVWADDKEWLDISSPEDIRILWGPNDKYIIIKDGEGDAHIVVYNLNTEIAETWFGKCNQIANSPTTDHLALWCSMQIDNKSAFGILEWNGDLEITTTPPVDPLAVIEWSFSLDGDRVLYINERFHLALINGDGTSLNLPVFSVPDLWKVRRNLQWSHNGSLILVYGEDQSSKLCPKFLNPERNERQQRPCWLVLDSTTGNIMWWPKEELADSLNSSWDRIDGTDYSATLSRDGKWLAMSLRESGIRYFVVTSIFFGRAFLLGDFDISALIWDT